ncbi:MAG: hypothetical protein IKD69_04060 [Solobacterium sp.]|nr:hypothetical protein [Solobacterium sp.]
MKDIETFVMNEKGFLGYIKGEPCFVTGQESYWLTCVNDEPCLCMQTPGNENRIIIRNAFVPADAFPHLMNGEAIVMGSGNSYDSLGVLKLLRAAVDGGRDQYDMTLLEGLVFMAKLIEAGAVSKETAMPVDLDNPRLLNAFVHAGKIIITEHGNAFLRPKGQ